MPSTQKYKSFIIHLQRALGRKAQIEDISAKSPFEVQMINAVDGSNLTKSEINNCYSNHPLYSLIYPFTLSQGEIGCFLSHKKVWQEIVDQDLTAGLIFEDDVHIDSNVFNKAVSLAIPHAEKLGYIQFQVRDVLDLNFILEKSDDTRIVQPTITPLRTSVQLVSRTVAKKLLDLTQKFDRPIDGFLQMHWETGIHLACVVPSGVSDKTQETGGSTLSTKHPIFKKIGRAVKRQKYRSQIRKYSRTNSRNTA